MVNSWFIPLRMNKEKQADAFKKYLATWTPTIVILDAEGKEHYRFTGFLSPMELSARIMLDGAKTEIDLGNYDLAVKCIHDVIDKYPGTYAVPEGIFYLGVAEFLPGHDPKVLKENLERLRKEFPKSEWTLRARPYELIKA